MHVADLGLYQSTTVDLSYTQLTPSLASSCHLTKATMLRSNLLCDVNLKSAFGLKLSSWAMTTRFILWLAQPPSRTGTSMHDSSRYKSSSQNIINYQQSIKLTTNYVAGSVHQLSTTSRKLGLAFLTVSAPFRSTP